MEFIKGKTDKKSDVFSTLPIDRVDNNGSNDKDYCDGEVFDEKRIWIGNLDETVPEYLLLKLAQQAGELTKFDMVYFRSGPDKGKPKGYCFVTYSKVESAKKAISSLDGYLLKSKRLVVRLANQPKQNQTEVRQPKPVEKKSQIAAIEAKLKLMEKEEPTSIKQKMISSVTPSPLMRINVQKPVSGQSSFRKERTQMVHNSRTKPY